MHSFLKQGVHSEINGRPKVFMASPAAISGSTPAFRRANFSRRYQLGKLLCADAGAWNDSGLGETHSSFSTLFPEDSAAGARHRLSRRVCANSGPDHCASCSSQIVRGDEAGEMALQTWEIDGRREQSAGAKETGCAEAPRWIGWPRSQCVAGCLDLPMRSRRLLSVT